MTLYEQFTTEEISEQKNHRKCTRYKIQNSLFLSTGRYNECINKEKTTGLHTRTTKLNKRHTQHPGSNAKFRRQG